MLTSSQLVTLKADILADPVLAAIPNTPDGAFTIRDLYALIATPDFYVWRTDLHEHEITNFTSPENTNWSWTTYKNQDVREQNAWVRMFNTSLSVNMGLANVRAGIDAIFSGTGAPATQRAHITAAGKRKANRLEKLFSVGAGALAAPATMVVEGEITYNDVLDARNLP